MGVAFVALLVALGGTGYAAIVLPANSVGSKQLKNKAVTGGKIAANAVTSPKVRNGSLLNADFAAGQLPAGPKGDKGDKGDTGQTGQTGQTGPPGPFPDPLQSGKTLRGTYVVDFTAVAGGEGRDNISFGFTLASNPTPVIRAPGAPATAQCPGSATNPQAAPGILCAYQSVRQNVRFECVAEVVTQSSDCDQSSRFGTSFYSVAGAAGQSLNLGTWAVTAP